MLDLKSTSFQAAAADGKFRSVVCVEGCRKVGLLLDRFCELCETVLTLAARCVCVQGWVSASVYSLLFPFGLQLASAEGRRSETFPPPASKNTKTKTTAKHVAEKEDG